MEQLGIGEVAELTGIAVGTLRMWEQRYGFPVPHRTSTGYRKYSSDDVEVLRRTLALREQGLSVGAALERAQEVSKPAATPSLYGSVGAVNGLPIRPRKLRNDTLGVVSRTMEDEALACGESSFCFGAFQRYKLYRQFEPRWQRLAQVSNAAVVFAD